MVLRSVPKLDMDYHKYGKPNILRLCTGIQKKESSTSGMHRISLSKVSETSMYCNFLMDVLKSCDFSFLSGFFSFAFPPPQGSRNIPWSPWIPQVKGWTWWKPRASIQVAADRRLRVSRAARCEKKTRGLNMWWTTADNFFVDLWLNYQPKIILVLYMLLHSRFFEKIFSSCHFSWRCLSLSP